jgi:hypothetical protein
MTTDLTKPLIVAQLDVTGHPPSPLLIDGIHRLYRTWREHVRGYPPTCSPPRKPAGSRTTCSWDRAGRPSCRRPRQRPDAILPAAYASGTACRRRRPRRTDTPCAETSWPTRNRAQGLRLPSPRAPSPAAHRLQRVPLRPHHHCLTQLLVVPARPGTGHGIRRYATPVVTSHLLLETADLIAISPAAPAPSCCRASTPAVRLLAPAFPAASARRPAIFRFRGRAT